MRIRKILVGAILGVSMSGAAAVSMADAPPIAVTLTMEESRAPDKAVYFPSDNVRIVIRLENTGAGDIITSEEFSSTPFQLYLNFVGPDGKGIVSEFRESTFASKTHVAPMRTFGVDPSGVYKQGEYVEFLPGTAPGPAWTVATTIPNVGVYYLTFDNTIKPGRYTVQARIPIATYSASHYDEDAKRYYALRAEMVEWPDGLASNIANFSVNADTDKDGYSWPEPSGSPPFNLAADCNDKDNTVHPWFFQNAGLAWVRDTSHEITCNGIDDDCDPGTPDQPVGVTCGTGGNPSGTLLLRAEKHTIGAGNYPPSTKTPQANLPYRIYKAEPGSCAGKIGMTWQKWPAIATTCNPADLVGTLDGNGVANIKLAVGKYLVLGLVNPDNSPIYISGTTILIGSAADIGFNQTTEKYLHLLVKADGKNVPAKYTVRTGSELMIIEPEYVEWTGTQELYPFVFQAVGDWGVVTSIAPPPGFVADVRALAADVNNAIQSVQFVVTDIGSDWVDTKVEHKLKHKGKEEIIRSKIGVKNSQKKKKKK